MRIMTSNEFMLVKMAVEPIVWLKLVDWNASASGYGLWPDEIEFVGVTTEAFEERQDGDPRLGVESPLGPAITVWKWYDVNKSETNRFKVSFSTGYTRKFTKSFDTIEQRDAFLELDQPFTNIVDFK